VSRNGYPLCEPPTHNDATENRGPILDLARVALSTSKD